MAVQAAYSNLVQFGVNTTAEIKPHALWRVLLENFCRDLLARVTPAIDVGAFTCGNPFGRMKILSREVRDWQ